MSKLRASIIGGSGYAGGELLRLLLDHPNVEIGQVTSESNTGKYVHALHPNLRGRTTLKFASLSTLEPCDILFVALPHGETMQRIAQFAELAPRIIDLSADFRLRDANDYAKWYESNHTAPEWLPKFVYGLPEINREAIRGTSYISGVGCNATASILATWPLFAADIVDRSRGVIVEVKAGSSEGGASSSPSSHHPDRSHVVRSFAPVGHRHTAEVIQALSREGERVPVHMSVTAIELVRGVLATAHAFVKPELAGKLELKDLWKTYRQIYGQEPFVRIIRERQGVYRYPEPKILAGSNYADVGFDYDPESGRIVAIAAIDNLMKGASGTAVQCMNLMCGWEETAGLGFPGLHPI
ncbi:MAG: N-acetyl-gamma-glutamyl-phosphate reductase [Chloroflexi bacterium]|jgi:N-acetyl-gamma-glutamyl-phosphate/LysW-gamma-L-alpha-aminoadipyl-6-phosphate reductase|nr:N-acetyl-gamma-glutamyl-phosphate reductase [Chloroflexota bacterium]